MNATVVRLIKTLLYGRRGEPIRYDGHALRYVVGTRPPRMAYASSADPVVRNELAQVRLFLDAVKPGDLVLDIGGHTGQYAVLLASLVGPGGRVVTFEPDPHARKVLERNVALNGFEDRVDIEPIALSDTEGEVTLWSLGGDSMSSMDRSGLGTNADAPGVVPIQVPSRRLDDYLAERGLPQPAAVKIDVEGAETLVLRGATRVLDSPALIVCEVHPYVWPGLGLTESDLGMTLEAAGRRFERLDGDDEHGLSAYGSGVLRRGA